jgi:hypothetical protein
VLGAGKVNIFSGASSNNASCYSVSGGRLLVRDTWYEGRGGGFLSASDGSTVTVTGSRVALAYGLSSPAFDFARFTGIAALLADSEEDRVVVSGPGTGKLLVAGVVGPNRYYFQNQSSAQAVLLNGKRVSRGLGMGSTTVSNQGNYDSDFLRATLAQTRPGICLPA